MTQTSNQLSDGRVILEFRLVKDMYIPCRRKMFVWIQFDVPEAQILRGPSGKF